MSKRQKAFALFREGKSATSPEVKDLGLKSHTRTNYYYEWEHGAGEAKGSTTHGRTGVSTKSSSGETIGGIDETKQPKKKAEDKNEETEDKNEETNSEKGVEQEEAEKEEPKVLDESIGGVDESRGKGEKKDEGEKEKKSKYEVTLASEGIRCVIYLSLQTLTLYEIAAAKQTQLSKDGEAKLTLGDYLDSCSEAFFKDRNLKLGLVEI